MIPQAIRGETLWEVLFGLGIVVIGLLIATIVSRFVFPIIRRITGRTDTKLDDYILAAVKTPIQVFIVVQSAFIALTAITLTNAWQEHINRVWGAAATGQIALVIGRLGITLLNWYGAEVASRTQTNWDNQVLPVLRRILSFLVYAIAVLLVLGKLGYPISPLLAGLGIGGLAIALALQPTLSNFISGTYVLTDGSIRTGDFVDVQGGPTGTVKEVGWRITRVQTADGNLMTIPNSKLADSIITNYSQPEPTMNMVLSCGVSYDVHLEYVELICLEVMRSLQERAPEVDKDFEPLVRFTGFGDSNINFNLVMRGIDRGATFFIKHQLMKELHARFAKEGIEMNYPVRKIIYAPENNAAAEQRERAAVMTSGKSKASSADNALDPGEN